LTRGLDTLKERRRRRWGRRVNKYHQKGSTIFTVLIKSSNLEVVGHGTPAGKCNVCS
jgi:hypothetical protein